MEQFEQLLTCCVCLDRYRNPKLLPCQHSFCMEPCMEGLTDYVRKQVKCPECRAEHRVPYNGIQAFPTNVTLTRFLELHIDLTGELPDPTSGQIMERCGVCSEKQYLSVCAHCEKKICEDCKSAHMDILRREISRINSQIKRSVNRLQDALSIIEKNTGNVQANCSSVTEELDEICRRVTKTVKDRTDELRSQVENYLQTELKKLKALKSNLEVEIGNIQSNCDLGDKHMNELVDWDDCELMDTKEIFLKTVEFLRNFEYESNESSKRIRFFMNKDPNQLVKDLAILGELNFPQQPVTQSSAHLAPPSMQSGLSRSKSDHRLTQFRNDDRNFEDEPVLGGRKFGERPVKQPVSTNDYDASSRYGRNIRDGGGDDYDFESPSTRTKRNFRSRFVKSHQNDDNSDSEHPRSGRSGNTNQDGFKNGERVIDTEDVSRGQLSGIIRIQDCARVIKKINESGKGKKEKKSDKPATPTPPVQQTPAVRPKPPAPAAAARQVSQEDEISRIKRQNKETTSTTPTTTTAPTHQTETEQQRPTSDRVAALRQQQRTTTQSSDESDSSPQNTTSTPRQQQQQQPNTHQTSTTPARTQQVEADSDSEEDSDSDDDSSPTTTTPQQSKPPPVPNTTANSTSAASKTKVARTTSTESSESTESSSSTPAPASTTTNRNSTATPNRNTSVAKTSTSSTPAAQPEKKPFVSRFLASHQAQNQPKKKEETESSSESETSSEEESEDDEPGKKSTTASSTTATTTSGSRASNSTTTPTQNSVNSRSATTAPTADSTSSSRRSSRDETNARTSAYSTPSSYTPRTRTVPAAHHEPEPDRYASGSSYTSRFLNRSKSSAILQPTSALNTSLEDDATDEDSRYGTGRSRYLAMKERRSRLARSRSSHALGIDDDDIDVDPPVSPTTASPSAYLASREAQTPKRDIKSTTRDTPLIQKKLPKSVHPEFYIPNINKAGYGTSSYGTDSGSALSRSRSTHALKSRESSPVNSTTGSASGGAKDGEALSSWARYLKNKYGNRRESTRDSGLSSATSTPSHASASSLSSASRRLSLGLPLRQANEYGSSDDDGSKNGLGSPTSPTVAGITGLTGTSPKQLYLRKRQQLFQLGGRGSEPGSFTWPRGIAVGPDNSIVVADSSNHRVQVFDSNGMFVKEFGEYGNAEGEFDCLAGVAVNRIGQYIIADRYNHRIQVLDPQGRFLRAFGSQGTADGKFSYPWGITTDSLGFIYVCDKENHRVQVFQSDGTFVGKFGTCGNEEGQLDHPHYIAVSNTNRVIVSDSNNHRIQIFDVNGKVLSAFGSEGEEEGQFKFPRGVAVDDQGYIFVADSGNNRIQIFNPDGSFLKAFGSWGSGECEFKGLEGIAIMSNGNILVCDRENHRIQVF